MPVQKRRAILNKNNQLPSIPEKLYFTIGEVAGLCQLKQHVLRYWETEFSQLSPAKRRGNRRYYQRADVLMVRKIRELLYERGYTIEGARQILSQNETPNKENVNAEAIRQAIKSLEKIVQEIEIV